MAGGDSTKTTMNARMRWPVETSVTGKPFFLSSGRGLTQRKCACGRSPYAGGECAECRAKVLPRRDASTSARPGYDFGSVRLHRDPIAVISGATPATGQPKPPTVFETPTQVSKEERVRFSKNKSVCLEPRSFEVEHGVCRNEANKATGLMAISFQGRGKTRFYGGTKQPFAAGERETAPDGKKCDCDCMLYRQFIRAIAFQRPPGTTAFQSIPRLTSGAIRGGLPANGQWHREDAPIYSGDCDCITSYRGCEQRYCDEPGVLNTTPGTDVLLRYNFNLQVWDVCEQKAVDEKHLTLTIAGDQAPRAIEWDPGWLPLRQDHIAIFAAFRPT